MFYTKSNIKKIDIFLWFIALSIPVIIGIYFNWCGDFFKPNTFKNWGDIVFPYDTLSWLKRVYFSWDDNTGVGLGNDNILHVNLPHSFFLFLLSKIGIPLWVINRINIIMPIAVMGWSIHYLFFSFTHGRYVWISSFTSILFALFAPTIDLDPITSLSLACFPFVLGSFIRLFDNNQNLSISCLVIPFGVMYVSFSPRNLYLSIIIIICYIIFDSITNKKHYNFIHRSKAVLILLVLIVIFNSYWMLSLFKFFLLQGGDYQNLFAHSSSYDERLNLFERYRNIGNPLWTFRLLLNTNDVSLSPYKMFLFLTPLYSYASIIFTKNKKVVFFIFASLILQLLSFAPYFSLTLKLHLLLEKYLFGFWILNNPIYTIYFSVLFNAILFGITTKGILSKISTLKVNCNHIKPYFNLLIILFIFFYIMFINGGLLTKRIWGYQNPNEFVKVPVSYFDLREYLRKNSKTVDRLLNLPWVTLGYAYYTWWPCNKIPMPDIVSVLSPIPVTGVGSHPSKLLQEKLGYNFNDFLLHNLLNEDYMQTLNDITQMGFKFILDHHDYYGVPLSFAPALGIYRPNITKSNLYKKALESPYFILWERKSDISPIFESCSEKPNIKTSEPKIKNVLKVNPTRYIIDVDDVYTPMVLSTKIPYSHYWKAKIVKNNSKDMNDSISFWEKWSLDIFPKDVVMYLNKIDTSTEYFNKYYLELQKEEALTNGSYRIIIEFEKQRFQSISILISIISIIFVSTYFIVKQIRMGFRQRERLGSLRRCQ